jgi:hypothetical protein
VVVCVVLYRHSLLLLLLFFYVSQHSAAGLKYSAVRYCPEAARRSRLSLVCAGAWLLTVVCSGQAHAVVQSQAV